MSWQDELNAVLNSWIGTPHVDGQCCRGRGVDCRYFLVAVLDELHGITAPLPPRVNPNLAAHDPQRALAIARDIIRRYSNRKVDLTTELIEPGDALITRPSPTCDANGHAMIAGVAPGEVWHSVAQAGVCRSSLAGNTHLILSAWRSTAKTSWKRRHESI